MRMLNLTSRFSQSLNRYLSRVSRTRIVLVRAGIYSTLSYFEAEILKKTGKTYDLCESFVANKTYMDRATQVVRLHGDCQFAQGGSAYDVLYTLEHYGICPESAMPFPGSLYGDSLNNFNEFFSLMEPLCK